MRDAKAATRGGWRVPAGLIGLGVVPLVAGGMRMVELAGGPVGMPESAASGMPVPLVSHILCVTAYTVLGAFQFVPKLRGRGGNGWHRRVGRGLVGFGLVAAFTGVWMAVRPEDGGLLVGIRVGFGTAMAVCVVLGFAAIRRREVARHRAWMIRGYAIGLGAGTQAFTQALWVSAVGVPGEQAKALLLGAGWVINVVVAEWVVRRGAR
ncbi:DUF2306 domain-containing protein [Nonomuraea sp. NPDC023979]|uniref:DUF2306 domain-containing protein n=1 Tax=Nonomuraea sp. NPDC023979 TaxID=3154796 RepID=UPI0033D4B9B0